MVNSIYNVLENSELLTYDELVRKRVIFMQYLSIIETDNIEYFKNRTFKNKPDKLSNYYSFRIIGNTKVKFSFIEECDIDIDIMSKCIDAFKKVFNHI